jgi:transposase-like protein
MVIIERYRRRELSIEEALIQMYLAGVSVQRIEDITQALWPARVSPATVVGSRRSVIVRLHTIVKTLSDTPFFFDFVWHNFTSATPSFRYANALVSIITEVSD